MADFHLFQELARAPSRDDAKRKPYQLVHGNTNHVLGNNDGSAWLILAIVGSWDARPGGLVGTDPETE